ncbi:hypothetical protein LTR17_014640 [Elasticomyces elasticus]|nr:hypothetical protein LTR17_014640 [Elasticomyces elasticus]
MSEHANATTCSESSLATQAASIAGILKFAYAILAGIYLYFTLAARHEAAGPGGYLSILTTKTPATSNLLDTKLQGEAQSFMLRFLHQSKELQAIVERVGGKHNSDRDPSTVEAQYQPAAYLPFLQVARERAKYLLMRDVFEQHAAEQQKLAAEMKQFQQRVNPRIQEMQVQRLAHLIEQQELQSAKSIGFQTQIENWLDNIDDAMQGVERLEESLLILVQTEQRVSEPTTSTDEQNPAVP